MRSFMTYTSIICSWSAVWKETRFTVDHWIQKTAHLSLANKLWASTNFLQLWKPCVQVQAFKDISPTIPESVRVQLRCTKQGYRSKKLWTGLATDQLKALGSISGRLIICWKIYQMCWNQCRLRKRNPKPLPPLRIAQVPKMTHQPV